MDGQCVKAVATCLRRHVLVRHRYRYKATVAATELPAISLRMSLILDWTPVPAMPMQMHMMTVLGGVFNGSPDLI
jgi:hypothetical protein